MTIIAELSKLLSFFIKPAKTSATTGVPLFEIQACLQTSLILSMKKKISWTRFKCSRDVQKLLLLDKIHSSFKKVLKKTVSFPHVSQLWPPNSTYFHDNFVSSTNPQISFLRLFRDV